MNEELDSQLSAMFDNELPAAECELLARRLSPGRGSESPLGTGMRRSVPPSVPRVESAEFRSRAAGEHGRFHPSRRLSPSRSVRAAKDCSALVDAGRRGGSGRQRCCRCHPVF